MFWYILMVVSAIFLTISIILVVKTYNEMWYIGVFAGGVIFVVMVAICIILPQENKKEIEIFKRNKVYIEQQAQYLTPSENYALTLKKIELNQWLYDAQYTRKNYWFFTFWTDEVLTLTEIK